MNRLNSCQDPQHRNETVSGICQKNCGLNPWVCARCLVEKHGDHKEKFLSIDQLISKALDRIRLLYDKLFILEQQYEQYIKIYSGSHKLIFENIQFYEESIEEVKNQNFQGNLIDQFIDKMKEKPQEQVVQQYSLMEQAIEHIQLKQQIELFNIQEDALKSQSQEFQRIGSNLFMEKKYKEAARYLSIVSIVNKQNIQSHLDYGRCLVELNRQNQALLCFDRAIKLEPRNWEPEFYKGISLKKSQKYLQAYNSFVSSQHKYLELHHRLNEDITIKIGSVLIKQNKEMEGLQKFDEIIKQNSQYEEGYLAKIKYLIKQKQFNAAQGLCNDLLKKQAQSKLGQFYLGIALLGQHRTEDAKLCFEKTMKLECEQLNRNLQQNYQEYGQSQRWTLQTNTFSRASTHRLHQQFE